MSPPPPTSTTAIKSATIAPPVWAPMPAVAGLGPAVLRSLAVAADIATGALVAIPLQGLDLTRRPRAVWPAGRTLTGPARDLLAIAQRRPVAE